MRRRTNINSKKLQAQILNSSTYLDYLGRLQKIATSMFEWVNLPSTMNQRYLEYCLFYFGQASMLYVDDLGYINLQAVDQGMVNMYNLPSEVECMSIGNHSYRRKVFYGKATDADGKDLYDKNEECILVLNNWDRIPTLYTIQLFAERLTEAERTIDVNIKNQKFPNLILTDEKQLLTMKNMYAQITGNEPAIYADKNSLSPDQIKTLNTEAPYIADKLMEYKKQIWNEALQFLGIQSLDEKKERLIVSETASSNEVTNMNLQSYLIPRQEACEKFNEKYGTNISVRVRSDLDNLIKRNNSVVSDLNKESE